MGCIIIMNEGRHDWGGSQPVILPALSVFGTDRSSVCGAEGKGAALASGGTLVYTHTTPGDQNGNPSLITRTQVKTIVTAKARLYTRGTVSYMVKESEMEKSKSLCIATSVEGRAIRRWSIYRKKALSLPKRTWRTTPRPCRN